MVVIRLTRGGAKKRPFYHIVAADKRSRRDGEFIERLGFYNPIASGNEPGLKLAVERLEYWKQQGAALSPTVARLARGYAYGEAVHAEAVHAEAVPGQSAPGQAAPAQAPAA